MRDHPNRTALVENQASRACLFASQSDVLESPCTADSPLRARFTVLTTEREQGSLRWDLGCRRGAPDDCSCPCRGQAIEHLHLESSAKSLYFLDIWICWAALGTEKVSIGSLYSRRT